MWATKVCGALSSYHMLNFPLIINSFCLLSHSYQHYRDVCWLIHQIYHYWNFYPHCRAQQIRPWDLIPTSVWKAGEAQVWGVCLIILSELRYSLMLNKSQLIYERSTSVQGAHSCPGVGIRFELLILLTPTLCGFALQNDHVDLSFFQMKPGWKMHSTCFQSAGPGEN